MKYYLIVNKDNYRINRALSTEQDTEPSVFSENAEAVEVSEELFNQYQENRRDFPAFYNGELKPISFLMELRRKERQEQLFQENPEQVKNQYIEKARQKRQEIEQSGFTFNGLTIPTDLTTQAKLNGAVVSAMLDDEFTTDWQVDSKTFIVLDATTIIELGTMMRNHVSGAFTWQKQKVEEINNATTFEELDSIEI